MRFLSNIIFIIILSVTVSSCITNDFTKVRLPDVEAEKNGFKKVLVWGAPFWITTYQRIISPKDRIVFYIEGDGHAFVRRFRISEDPTPRDPMLLRLAFSDPRANVVYIARPCQYTPMEQNPACNKAYWTDKRLSKEVVDSMNMVITSVAEGKKFDLVGFSGGGGIAVLVAAKNEKVNSILTIAGNLDHVEFNKFHRVRPMIGSLNPIDYAKKINHIPQLHVSGGEDKIVPVFINQRYIDASMPSKCVKREIIPEASHNKKWNKFWDYIVNIPINCKNYITK